MSENKVTLEGIKAKIKAECYLVLPDGRTTICMLSMENGYTIKGMSACVDAANFNLDIGRAIAYEDAIRQIWPLEGYLLAEKMYLDRPRSSEAPDKSVLAAAFDAFDKEIKQAKKTWTVTASEGKMVAAAKKRGRPSKKAAPFGLKKDGTPKAKPGRKTAS